MKNSLFRKIIKGFSLTGAMFVFQACYGPPQDYLYDLYLQGHVKSKTTGLPIKGIKISVKDNMQYEITDEEGKFAFYTEWQDSVTVQIEDIDGIDNGSYFAKDTILTGLVDNAVHIEIALEEK